MDRQPGRGQPLQAVPGTALEHFLTCIGEQRSRFKKSAAQKEGGRSALRRTPVGVYPLVKMDCPVEVGTSGSDSLILFSAMADASASILSASSLFSAW